MASSNKCKPEKNNETKKAEQTSKALSKTNKEKDNKEQNKKKKKKKLLHLSNGNSKHHNKASIFRCSSSELKPKEQQEEEDKTVVPNGRTSGTKPKKRKQEEHREEDEEDAKTLAFPMNRIRTMIKGEDPDLRVSQEAILAINKAAEKFLEQFTQDAYTSCVQERKKSLSYNHLAHVVSKQRRYDFLCDFVPEKVKAEEALRERNSGGNGGG